MIWWHHNGGTTSMFLSTVRASTLYTTWRQSWDTLGKVKIKERVYPKDPRIVPYPLETLKYSHALTSWTCANFFQLNDCLGQVVIQSKKSPHKSNSFRCESIQSCQCVWHDSWVFRVIKFGTGTIAFNKFQQPIFGGRHKTFVLNTLIALILYTNFTKNFNPLQK